MKVKLIKNLLKAIDSGKTKDIPQSRLDWAKKNMKQLRNAVAGKGKPPLAIVRTAKSKTTAKKPAAKRATKPTSKAATKKATVTPISSRRKTSIKVAGEGAETAQRKTA